MMAQTQHTGQGLFDLIGGIFGALTGQGGGQDPFGTGRGLLPDGAAGSGFLDALSLKGGTGGTPGQGLATSPIANQAPTTAPPAQPAPTFQQQLGAQVQDPPPPSEKPKSTSLFGFEPETQQKLLSIAKILSAFGGDLKGQQSQTAQVFGDLATTSQNAQIFQAAAGTGVGGQGVQSISTSTGGGATQLASSAPRLPSDESPPLLVTGGEIPVGPSGPLRPQGVAPSSLGSTGSSRPSLLDELMRRPT